jgi:hypothetical protein
MADLRGSIVIWYENGLTLSWMAERNEQQYRGEREFASKEDLRAYISEFSGRFHIASRFEVQGKKKVLVPLVMA